MSGLPKGIIDIILSYNHNPRPFDSELIKATKQIAWFLFTYGAIYQECELWQYKKFWYISAPR